MSHLLSRDVGTSTRRADDWRSHGHCATDPTPFFIADDAPHAGLAIAACLSGNGQGECPVLDLCAAARGGEGGVWGGRWHPYGRDDGRVCRAPGCTRPVPDKPGPDGLVAYCTAGCRRDAQRAADRARHHANERQRPKRDRAKAGAA